MCEVPTAGPVGADLVVISELTLSSHQQRLQTSVTPRCGASHWSPSSHPSVAAGAPAARGAWARPWVEVPEKGAVAALLQARSLSEHYGVFSEISKNSALLISLWNFVQTSLAS